MRSCDNCERDPRTTERYVLRLDTQRGEEQHLEMALCEQCSTELLSLEWIRERDAEPAD